MAFKKRLTYLIYQIVNQYDPGNGKARLFLFFFSEFRLMDLNVFQLCCPDSYTVNK